jgi:acyl dehydratase
MTTHVTSPQALLDLAGKPLGTSRWVEVTQDQVNLFADATGDHQWIHVDPQRAASGPFGTTIAHGFLTLYIRHRPLKGKSGP